MSQNESDIQKQKQPQQSNQPPSHSQKPHSTEKPPADTMASTEPSLAAPDSCAQQPCVLLVPSWPVSDPSLLTASAAVQQQANLAGIPGVGMRQCVVATMIQDDDLTFGGRPLSAWHEDERRRASGCLGDDELQAAISAEEQAQKQRRVEEEENTRGRPRVRLRIDRAKIRRSRTHHNNLLL